MMVFLFGLSPRSINLINISTELVQLILLHLFISSCDVLFMFGCIWSWHNFQCILLIQIYRYTCACPCTLLGIHHTTRWGAFWLPWILMFRSQSLELVDSLGCWSKMLNWSVDHRQTVWNLILLDPLVRLSSFPFCNSWALFVLFILVYLFVFSHLRLWVM